MPTPKTVTWPADPHTLAKHEIVRKYMSAWVPIMARTYSKIGMIDGFSGPGEYVQADGSILEGSPMIMLRALLDRKDRDELLERTEFLYLFIDEDERRIDHLEDVIHEKIEPIPDGVQIECSDSSFKARVTELFDDVEARGFRNAVPMFVLVDPFGFKGLPFDVIARILENPHSEVMVTFMVDSVNRWLKHPGVVGHVERLMGMEREGWDDVLRAKNRFDALRDLYTAQLKTKARYVRSCRMISKKNRPIYELVFASNNPKGIDKFKDAMWKVDPIGGGSFSDVTAGMETLYDARADTTPLRKLMLERFAGEVVTLTQIESFVDDTPFLRSDIRRRTLDPMVQEELVEYIPPNFGKPKRRAKGTFPLGCRIRFPA